MNSVKIGNAKLQVHILQKSSLCIALGWFFLFLPLLLFVYFPSQDGPAHVNSAAALNRLAVGDPFFFAYFKSIPLELTNWAGEKLYRLLLHYSWPRHIDMLGAIIYVAFALIIIHLCSHIFLKIKPDSAILFYPLIFTTMFHMGSYNLSLATFAFFAVVSICSAYVAQRKHFLLFTLSAALLFTYTLHIEIAFLAMVVTGICGLWIGTKAFFNKEGSGAQNYRNAIVEIAKVAAASVPAFILIVFYFFHNRSQMPSHLQYPALISRLENLFLLTGIASYSLFGLAVSACLFCAMVVLIYLLITNRFGERTNKSQDWLLLSAACFGILLLFMPDGLGDIFAIEQRIMVPFLMILAIWLAWGIQSINKRKTIVMTVLFILALQTLNRALAFEQFNRQAKEFIAIRRCIPEKTAFISVDLDSIAPQPLSRIMLHSLTHPFMTFVGSSGFYHFPGTIFADRKVVDASNYEALEICPYFQLKYQPWLADMVGVLDVGEKVILEYQETGLFSAFVEKLRSAEYPIDFLITSTFNRRERIATGTQDVMTVIDSNYDLTCTSPSGAVRVYRLKESSNVE